MPSRSVRYFGFQSFECRRLRQVIIVARMIGVALLFQMLLSSNVLAQFDGRPLGHSYVINAPLPLRSITLFQSIDDSGELPVGKIPLAQLSNDTEVDKFQSTVDGWAYVRVVKTGQEGWAREMVDGVRHITCCHPQEVDSAKFPPPGKFEQLNGHSIELGNRILLVKKITEREFLFTLSIGVMGVAIQCDETMTECLKIGGSAIREGTSYIYRDPQSGRSHVRLQVVSEDEISISVDNWHPVGSSKEQGMRITGLYHRDRGVGVEASYVGFKMPSGNIICHFGTDPDYLECQIRGHHMSFPNTDCSNPGFDDGYPGRIFLIKVDSKRGRPGCLTDQFYFLQMFNEVPYLQYGDTWRKSDFVCKSEKRGLTCSNSSGHGFFLSKARQTVF
jgi:hypothetical protein